MEHRFLDEGPRSRGSHKVPSIRPVCNNGGTELVQCYMIPKVAHGTPLASGDDEDECGAPDSFSLEVGILSSYHIAKFRGLTE
jgi:hypothetical protein